MRGASGSWRRATAVAREIFRRAQERGEIAADADLEVLHTVLPSICTFHQTVLGHSVDADFVARVIDQVVLPAARLQAQQTPTPKDL